MKYNLKKIHTYKIKLFGFKINKFTNKNHFRLRTQPKRHPQGDAAALISGRGD
jgi:hypothetical protein